MRTSTAPTATRSPTGCGRFEGPPVPYSSRVAISARRHGGAGRRELLRVQPPRHERRAAALRGWFELRAAARRSAYRPRRTARFFFWHVFVEGLAPGVGYAWRVDGPGDASRDRPRVRQAQAPARPLGSGRERCAVGPPPCDRRTRPRPCGDACNSSPGPQRRRRHGRALARASRARSCTSCTSAASRAHPSSGVRNPGTFAGLIEKIPYLKDLGITHVELMPVMAFDEQDVPDGAFTRGLRNYWGYSTHSFFSPHPRYCVNPAEAPREFRELTDAFHAAGIGVLVDVVFNHTAEGGAHGPVINFKGLANDVFYHLDCHGPAPLSRLHGMRQHRELQPPARDQLHRRVASSTGWSSLGVDGFRFDLASVFARGQDGELMTDPPVPWAIETSRTLARVPRDRRGLGRGGALPRGRIPRHGMGGVERPLPRRHASVRAWRSRPASARWRIAHRRQRGPLRGRRAAALQQRQFRHVPRRVHAPRPRELRRQAQRGERRGQPRRQQRQPRAGTTASRAKPPTRR